MKKWHVGCIVIAVVAVFFFTHMGVHHQGQSLLPKGR